MSILKTALNIIPRPWLIRLSYLAKPLTELYFRGNKFTDPINGKSYRKFLPYGYHIQRKNALSPSTLSLERHRLLWLYLQKESNFFKDDLKVLHIAPEQCFYKQFRKQQNLDYLTSDLESPLADVKADICDLPFEDNSFDVVFCNHVLEHIPNDAKALSELYRVMKKGGWGIFQIPQDVSRETTYEDDTITDREERIKHFGQYDHVRVYGLDYFDRLANAGFTVKQILPTDLVSKEEVKRFALIENEILPIVYKL